MSKESQLLQELQLRQRFCFTCLPRASAACVCHVHLPRVSATFLGVMHLCVLKSRILPHYPVSCIKFFKLQKAE